MPEELLTLCGFSESEIVVEGPRINRAFRRWGIGTEDIEKAVARLRQYFDIELSGIRQFLGIWLREFVDLTLSKDEGKKVIYSSYPPIGPLVSTLADLTDDIYCGIPETTILAVMGQIFGKLTPTLEAAERTWLPPGQAHCQLLVARLGAMLQGSIPIPDLLLANGIICDQAGKTDEIITELHGTPVIHIDTGFSTETTLPPHVDPERVSYLAEELRQAVLQVEAVTGHKITDEDVDAGRAKFRGLRQHYYEIQELLKVDPLPLSMKDFGLIGFVISSYLKQIIDRGDDAASILIDELKQRICDGKGVMPAGAPRVLIIFPHMGDPSVTEVIEQAGLVIAASSRSQSYDKAPLQYTGTWEKAAELLLRTGGSVTAMASQLRDLAKTHRVDGVIINTISQCRIYNLHPLVTKQMIEAELGIPALVIEHDPYDSREYSPEQLQSRVEPFAEMLRSRMAK